MQSETGSFIRVNRKVWQCECCGADIKIGTQHFVRITEDDKASVDSKGNLYTRLYYQRWHLFCALSINGLNEVEKRLLAPFLMALYEVQKGQGATNVIKIGVGDGLT